jgi:hypothetical protein
MVYTFPENKEESWKLKSYGKVKEMSKKDDTEQIELSKFRLIWAQKMCFRK